MSPAAQAAIAGGAVGGVFTLLGVALGLFGERWVRSRGQIRCALTFTDKSWSRDSGASVHEAVGAIIDTIEDFGPVYVYLTCSLAFFNNKEVDIGITNIFVAFVSDGSEARIGYPDPQPGAYTVNLNARTWSETTIRGVVSGPESRLVRDWQTIEVRGMFPDHSPFRRTVWKRVGAEIHIASLFNEPPSTTSLDRGLAVNSCQVGRKRHRILGMFGPEDAEIGVYRAALVYQRAFEKGVSTSS